LHGAESSRRIEQAALAGVPPHTLMRRAGTATARLALALLPHARKVWVAAGPGNNGGDGLEAAIHLSRAGRDVLVTLLADESTLPDDARDALARARQAGVPIDGELPAAREWDLAIDALLGIGARRAPAHGLRDAILRLNECGAPVLAVDLPSGLHPETGQPLGDAAVRACATLSLLTLKPGLFTGLGRDHAGQVWIDPLGVSEEQAPDAWLCGSTVLQRLLEPRAHALHKGSFGDLLVIGGAAGMTGAALLAARCALVLGAGRVYLSLLDGAPLPLDAGQPELMLRTMNWALRPETLTEATVVCGCGGSDAVRGALPAVIHHAARLVLDADGLNAISADTALRALLRARRLPTVITPHPLEAARLLGAQSASVQADRVKAARSLAEHLACTVLLKGSGSVVASADTTPLINPTGNALLASAGTGDVLAGAIGALWALGPAHAASDVAAAAAFLHGAAADAAWDERAATPLTASRLIDAMRLAASRLRQPR
jgi:hydroxyethylthiazole kinase-like uncharacterized protein yjeF